MLFMSKQMTTYKKINTKYTILILNFIRAHQRNGPRIAPLLSVINFLRC